MLRGAEIHCSVQEMGFGRVFVHSDPSLVPFEVWATRSEGGTGSVEVDLAATLPHIMFQRVNYNLKLKAKRHNKLYDAMGSIKRALIPINGKPQCFIAQLRPDPEQYQSDTSIAGHISISSSIQVARILFKAEVCVSTVDVTPRKLDFSPQVQQQRISITNRGSQETHVFFCPLSTFPMHRLIRVIAFDGNRETLCNYELNHYDITVPPCSDRRIDIQVLPESLDQVLTALQETAVVVRVTNMLNDENTMELVCSGTTDLANRSRLQSSLVCSEALHFGHCAVGNAEKVQLLLKNMGNEKLDLELQSSDDKEVSFELSSQSVQRSRQDSLSSLEHESFPENEDNIDEVSIPPGKECSLLVWYTPHLDVTPQSLQLDQKKELGQLQLRRFYLYMSCGQEILKTITCAAQVSTSFIQVNDLDLHLGNCPIHIPTQHKLSITNISAIETTVDFALKSSSIHLKSESVFLEPFATKEISFTFTPFKVNLNYHKEIYVSNQQNENDIHVITVSANCVDMKGKALHSLFYRLEEIDAHSAKAVASINFGSLAVQTRSTKVLRISNISLKTLHMDMTPASADVYLYEYGDAIGSDRGHIQLLPPQGYPSKCVFHNAEEEVRYIDEVVAWSKELSSTLGSARLAPFSHLSLEPLEKKYVLIVFTPTSKSIGVREMSQKSWLKHYATSLCLSLSLDQRDLPSKARTHLPQHTFKPTLDNMWNLSQHLPIESLLCEPSISLAQNHIDFGVMRSLQATRRTLIVKNDSELPLMYTFDKSGFIASNELYIGSDQQNECLVGIIKPCSVRFIPLLFMPSLAGRFLEKVHIRSIVDPYNRKSIIVRAYIQKPATFWLQSLSLNFQSCRLHTASETQHILIKNISDRTREFKLKSTKSSFSQSRARWIELRPELLFELGRLHEALPPHLARELDEEREKLEQKLKIAIRKNKLDKIEKIKNRLQEIRDDSAMQETDAQSGSEEQVLERSITITLPPNAVQTVIARFRPNLVRADRIIPQLRDVPCSGSIAVYERNNKERIRDVFYDAVVRVHPDDIGVDGRSASPSPVGQPIARGHERSSSPNQEFVTVRQREDYYTLERRSNREQDSDCLYADTMIGPDGSIILEAAAALNSMCSRTDLRFATRRATIVLYQGPFQYGEGVKARCRVDEGDRLDILLRLFLEETPSAGEVIDVLRLHITLDSGETDAFDVPIRVSQSLLE